MQAETQINCCWKSVQRGDKFRQRPKSTAAGNLYREGFNSGKDPNPLLLEICTVKGEMQAKTQIHYCWKSVQRRDKCRQRHKSTAAGNLYRVGINSGRDTNPLLLEICTEKG